MGYTISEKILLAHTGRKSIKAGDFIDARIDFCLGNDITAPIAISEFEGAGAKKVFDNSRIALIPDHFLPGKDMKSANNAKALREFSKKHGIMHYYEVGRMGVEHALLPELGLVLPGDLVIGADSHTCTYGALGCFSCGVGSTDLAAAFITGRCWLKVPESIKFVYHGKPKKWVSGKDLILSTIADIGVDGALYKSMEFSGEAIKNLPMDDRFSMCNMAIEAGAKNGIIEPDLKTIRYVKQAVRKNKPKRKSLYSKGRFATSCGKLYKSDKDARYAAIKEYDVSKIEPQVSLPYLPSNAVSVNKVKNVSIDQVVIGSCTNGRISDLEIAAKLLKGNKVKQGVRLIVIPATQAVYIEAVKRGLAKILVEAGGVFSTPSCGPCLGGHLGILAEDEVCISTTNRNFVGRMGHPKSKVYLASPAVAAASAVRGKIAHPKEVV
ncbi:MAG: 3-isopropylmalate dehydratase large subunit [Omnitrophica bacterium RBG_13_46_9]|nr:MAG: 3-isopropylmalate dehydratase large subunit [Omnitrophica bacterium RBG_13_46_9]